MEQLVDLCLSNGIIKAPGGGDSGGSSVVGVITATGGKGGTGGGGGRGCGGVGVGESIGVGGGGGGGGCVDGGRKNLYSLKVTSKPLKEPMASYLNNRGYKVWNLSEEPIIVQSTPSYHNKKISPSLRSRNYLGKLIEETVTDQLD
ncbi:loricrin-like [Panonychus citri]|uniref:loricrin-like n=1 Tax=Panonychus citri TaxID=50023 RepID=UPI002307AA4E|nr:loricrin-like [Panonychus citri]